MKGSSRAAFCLMGSAAVHAGIVAALVQTHGDVDAVPVRSHPLQVRLAASSGFGAVTGGAAQRSGLRSSGPTDLERRLAAFMPEHAPVAPVAPALPPLEQVALAALPGPGPASQRAGVRYYLPSELHERPHLAESVEPNLTMPVADLPPQDLELRLMINRDGTIDAVVIEDDRVDARVRDAVVLQFQRLTFSPGKLDGRAVNSQIRIQVHLDAAAEVISRTVVH